MNTYVILRRDGWGTADDLQLAAERSTAAGEEMPDEVRWIRSYVLEEADRIRRHGLRLPGDESRGDQASRRQSGPAGSEIIQVADTVYVRPDPNRSLPDASPPAWRAPAIRRRLWRAAADAGHEGGFAPVRVKTHRSGFLPMSSVRIAPLPPLPSENRHRLHSWHSPGHRSRYERPSTPTAHVARGPDRRARHRGGRRGRGAAPPAPRRRTPRAARPLPARLHRQLGRADGRARAQACAPAAATSSRSTGGSARTVERLIDMMGIGAQLWPVERAGG